MPKNFNQLCTISGQGNIYLSNSVWIGKSNAPYFIFNTSYLSARNNSSSIFIDDNVKINNQFVAIADNAKIHIGKNTLIGACVEILTSDFHGTSVNERNYKYAKSGDVIIGQNVFIGDGVRILKGVEIGDGATIGAGSTVRNNINKNIIFY